MRKDDARSTCRKTGSSCVVPVCQSGLRRTHTKRDSCFKFGPADIVIVAIQIERCRPFRQASIKVLFFFPAMGNLGI